MLAVARDACARQAPRTFQARVATPHLAHPRHVARPQVSHDRCCRTGVALTAVASTVVAWHVLRSRCFVGRCWITGDSAAGTAWRFLQFFIPLWLAIIYVVHVYIRRALSSAPSRPNCRFCMVLGSPFLSLSLPLSFLPSFLPSLLLSLRSFFLLRSFVLAPSRLAFFLCFPVSTSPPAVARHRHLCASGPCEPGSLRAWFEMV